jgi:regulator of protease activity HflC (stomatin/prohibitin superfamily)
MKERPAKTVSGALMLGVWIALTGVMGYLLYWLATSGGPEAVGSRFWYALWGFVLLCLVWSVGMNGFFIVEPNESRVLLLFGRYMGTVRDAGFHYVNPLMSKRKVSLRVRTLNGEKLKVNDIDGNLIEIAAVVVWRVRDTYEAVFEVEDYEQYVATQSETAVRQLASSYPYDAEGTISLRHNAEEISEELRRALQERLNLAGVEVLEARISHLAYAPEIASVMLRRQQANAVIAARQRIVEGAVGMVEMALEHLERSGTVQLDEERKAAMVSNLMVVLCSEQATQPIVNTGTLYP